MKRNVINGNDGPDECQDGTMVKKVMTSPIVMQEEPVGPNMRTKTRKKKSYTSTSPGYPISWFGGSQKTSSQLPQTKSGNNNSKFRYGHTHELVNRS